jgi:hypothetical protein
MYPYEDTQTRATTAHVQVPVLYYMDELSTEVVSKLLVINVLPNIMARLLQFQRTFPVKCRFKGTNLFIWVTLKDPLDERALYE